MWIIALILFSGESYKIASDQMIYQTREICEMQRIDMLYYLQSTAPEGGVVLSKCVNMERNEV